MTRPPGETFYGGCAGWFMDPDGHLWEIAVDHCQVCGAVVGMGVRFLHLGLCDACRATPTN